MSASNDTTSCIGCGATVPDVDYPAWRPEKYPAATSSGCYKIYYEEIPVREYSDWKYPPIHRLTVDAYAAQHPGQETPQTIQSVIVHLTSINVVLAKDVPPETATEMMQHLIDTHADEFSWLDPPANRGDITVVDVAQARDLDEHTALVTEWTHSVWEAWDNHHSTLEQWTQRALDY
jgi:hypothetical protein